jgi:hypothetical protein
MAQTIITSGKAVIKQGGLRCASPRESDPSKICNYQFARLNSSGQIAGNFLCRRCDQSVEVKVVSRP